MFSLFSPKRPRVAFSRKPRLEVLEDRLALSGFADDFEAPTLNPFWTKREDAGAVVFPSTTQVHGGAQAVALTSFANAGQKNIELRHTFAAPVYGRVSVWVYDTGADELSSNYIGLEVQNHAAGTVASLLTQDYDLGPTNGGIYYYSFPGSNGGQPTAIDRTKAWHQFTIDAAPTGLSLAVDGITVYAGAPTQFDFLAIDIIGPTWRPAWTAYFDDFEFVEYSAPPPPPPSGDFIYYSDVGLLSPNRTINHIKRARLDGTDVQIIQTSVASNPSGNVFGGIAIDVANGHLYSGDRTTIFRTNLDGSGRVNLTSNGVTSAPNGDTTDVELDLVHGKIYWSSRNIAQQMIYRANLDGSNLQLLFNPFSGRISGIALDPVNGKLYFADSNGAASAIRVMNLDGTGQGVIKSLPADSDPYDVDIDVANGKLYWNQYSFSNPAGRLLRRANLDGTGPIEDLHAVAPNVIGSSGIHFDTQAQQVYFALATNTGPSFLGVNRINAAGGGQQFILNDGDGFHYLEVVHLNVSPPPPPPPPNSPPILGPITNQVVDEQTTLAFSVTATDPDVGQSLSYSLDAAPAGAAIDPGTGAFSWTPGEADGPGDFTVSVRVTDNGSPALGDTKTFSIRVNEVNRPPVLAPISHQIVNEGGRLQFTATATDPDLPANTLTYSLGSGAPRGAGITAAGVFTWSPDFAQSGTYSVPVVVTDGRGGVDNRVVSIQVVDVAEDVTARIRITRTAMRYNHATGRYVQVLTLQNIGPGAINGPISVVVANLTPTARLHNPSGTTTGATGPAGNPYVNVSPAGGVFLPGQTLTLTLEFVNPLNLGFGYSTRLLAGLGLR